MFWRDSKLAELGPQPMPPSLPVSLSARIGASASKHARSRIRPSQLVLIGLPCFSAPLSPRMMLDELVAPAAQGGLVTVTYQALLPQSSGSDSVKQTAAVQYAVDGLMLMVKSASVSASSLLKPEGSLIYRPWAGQYESGLTPLAVWIPRDELQQFGQALAPHNQSM